MKFIKSPCLDCKERRLGCHSKCKKYNSYKQKLYQDRYIARNQKEYIGYLSEAGGALDRMKMKRG